MSGRHDDTIAPLKVVRLSVDTNFDLAVENLDEGVEISRMFGESLPLIEGEKGYIPRLVLCHLFTYYAASGVIYRGFKGDSASFFVCFHYWSYLDKSGGKLPFPSY